MFFAIAICCTEILWRSLGYGPFRSEKTHFAEQRKWADQDRNAVALVGSSRVECGLDPVTLDRTIPGRHFLQLAIPGTSPFPVLWDLANDADFKGLVIAEFNPQHWGTPYGFTNLPATLAYSHREISGSYLETMLFEHLREHFSFISYNLFGEIPKILRHRATQPAQRADRFMQVHDFGPATNEHIMRQWELSARDAAQEMRGTGASLIPLNVQTWIKQIRSRGGDVAFVRMPVDGRLRVVEEQLFPSRSSIKQDILSHGIVLIDFADLPEHFYCPDGSHLEASDAERFSRRLGQLLASKQFFR